MSLEARKLLGSFILPYLNITLFFSISTITAFWIDYSPVKQTVFNFLFGLFEF